MGKEHEPALGVESSTSLKTSHQECLLKIRIPGLNPEWEFQGKGLVNYLTCAPGDPYRGEGWEHGKPESAPEAETVQLRRISVSCERGGKGQRMC